MAQQAKYWFPAALSLLLVGWGANQYVALLVHYRQDHGFSEVLVTSLLGIYVLGLVPALLLGGRASDLRGRKRLTMIAVLISIAASLALMLSHQAGSRSSPKHPGIRTRRPDPGPGVPRC